jgi:hypothetical protein
VIITPVAFLVFGFDAQELLIPLAFGTAFPVTDNPLELGATEDLPSVGQRRGEAIAFTQTTEDE